MSIPAEVQRRCAAGK